MVAERGCGMDRAMGRCLRVFVISAWVAQALAQGVGPVIAGAGASGSRLPLGAGGGAAVSPLGQAGVSPGVLFLFELERRFAADVAVGGGKAFAGWFADDAVTLNNGKAAVLGRGNIAAQTRWGAADYQLTWVPEGGQMMPLNDAGYTWGRYEGRSKDQHGEAVVTSGRYITLWKKTASGDWKVALDASANEPAEAGACCVLPKP